MDKTFMVGPVMGVMLVAAGLGSANAQQYPAKPIHFIVPGPGGVDLIARKILPVLGEALGQSVVIENLPGGPRPGQAVMKAEPDGYTLFLTGRGHWLVPLRVKDAPYDPVKDFAAISLIWDQPYVLIVNTKLPVNSVKELIALVKQRPDKINMGAGSQTGTGTLTGTLFRQMAGINITAVPYKTGSARSAALLSGEIEVDFLSSSGTLTALKGGATTLKALAVTSKQPSPQFPDLPPIAQTVPGYELTSNSILFAPARTPPQVINTVNRAANKVLKDPAVVKMLAGFSADAVPSTPKEAADFVKADLEQMGKLLKSVGVKAQ